MTKFLFTLFVGLISILSCAYYTEQCTNYSAEEAYGAIGSNTGYTLGTGIAHVLGSQQLNKTLPPLLAFANSFTQRIQGRLSNLTFCLNELPPKDKETQEHISKAVNYKNGEQIAMIVGGPILGPKLAPIFGDILVERSVFYNTVVIGLIEYLNSKDAPSL